MPKVQAISEGHDRKRGEKEVRKRPGKRQRLELKATGVDPSSGKKFKKKERTARKDKS